MASASTTAWLDQFECLDVIGNGSFGVIRKVRRKSDGAIFARKDLSFALMSERDRRQIVAEVNILKDLHHEHIVRYHDRHVDRDEGILYMIMEYCGGGDLSALIRRAARDAERAGEQPRGLPEDKVWHFLMQLLRALVHCHHPNTGGTATGAAVAGNGRGLSLVAVGDEAKRPQILHRDLKPDNVFLDEDNNIKLGDFGLSKALLQQTSFASTYVGTPYYMSPELMQEKAYDTKTDIWSLGCLVYELCALKPPFHEARTHPELANLIKNGRIPPLPRGYSQTLQSTIKAMLNLNPAMRPSAHQLLSNERIDLAAKQDEMGKLMARVKAQKETVMQREHALVEREQVLAQRGADVVALQQALAHADAQVQAAHAQAAQLQAAQTQVAQLQAALADAQASPASDADVHAALAVRDAEHAARAAERDAEVARAWDAREAELLAAVRARELELERAWGAREAALAAQAADAAAAHARAFAAREDEVRVAWERREEEVRVRWDEMEDELRTRVEAREAEVERAWAEREAELDREAEERVQEAVDRVIGELRRLRHDKSPSEEVHDAFEAGDVSSSSFSSDAADTSTQTVTASFSSEEGHSISTVYPTLKAALCKTPLPATVGRSAHRFLKTPLPALARDLLETANPPARAEPPPSPSAASVFGSGPETTSSRAVPGSAMRGVVLTATGQPLSTPSPAEFMRMFSRPLPRVALDFSRAKPAESLVEEDEEDVPTEPDEPPPDRDGDRTPRPEVRIADEPTTMRPVRAPPPATAPASPRRTRSVATASSSRLAPSSPVKANERSSSPVRRERTLRPLEMKRTTSSNSLKRAAERTLTRTASVPAVPALAAPAPATRARRPSVGSSAPKPREQPAAPAKSSKTSESSKTAETGRTVDLAKGTEATSSSSASSSASSLKPSGLSASDSSSASSTSEPTSNEPSKKATSSKTSSSRQARAPAQASLDAPAAQYDLEDEENLPSPFLKRIDRDRFPIGPSGAGTAPSRVKAAPSAPAAAPLAPAPILRPRPKPATSSVGASNMASRRLSGANALRAVAAANSAAGRDPSPGPASDPLPEPAPARAERPAVANAKSAREQARQRLLPSRA